MTKSNFLFEAVVKKLESNKVFFNIIEHKPLFIMEDVYNTLNVKPEKTAKTILLSVDDYGLIAVVVPGLSKVDLAKIAKSIIKPRNKIKFAEKKEVEKIGISIGSVSPFFDCFAKMIVDKSLLSQDIVFCGSGDLSKTISVQIHNLLKITSAEIADVIKDKQPTGGIENENI